MRHRPVTVAVALSAVRELRFHRRRGSNITVSGDGLTASVTSRDLDAAAVVTSCRPLHSDELFEFRVDRVIESLSASLEAGMSSTVLHYQCMFHKLHIIQYLQQWLIQLLNHCAKT